MAPDVLMVLRTSYNEDTKASSARASQTLQQWSAAAFFNKAFVSLASRIVQPRLANLRYKPFRRDYVCDVKHYELASPVVDLSY